MADTYSRQQVAVVTAVGEFDADTIGPIAGRLTGAAATHPVVVLDASALTFADSTFLNLLLQVRRQTTLRIAAPGKSFLRLLAITGTDTVLDVRPSVEDAVRP
ncbi:MULTISPECIES: STAS domain-containing protein [unclassified Streptomyces]|uniref:STAS domain-containing protein n=1 Tax=unclassified Streptomyces TaxID=2593676 RepID=UPI002E350C44|nr:MULTISPECIES: STAS domain-containing protein [unclassified Streptomyces]